MGSGMKTLLALLLVVWITEAKAASVYVCPKTGFASTPLEAARSIDGSAPWQIYLPTGEINMFLKGTTLYCKYEGMFITKEVGEGCVLESNEGAIVTNPKFRDSKYCKFADELGDQKAPCLVTCR